MPRRISKLEDRIVVMTDSMKQEKKRLSINVYINFYIVCPKYKIVWVITSEQNINNLHVISIFSIIMNV